jgi:hypothetical protein
MTLDLDAIDARLATLARHAEDGILAPAVSDLMSMGFDLRAAVAEIRRLRNLALTYGAPRHEIEP